MEHIMEYTPKGVCSRQILFEIEDDIIKSVKFVGGCPGNTREFDSWISKKVLTGRIKPAFFMSNFPFLCLLFYVIVWYNKG